MDIIKVKVYQAYFIQYQSQSTTTPDQIPRKPEKNIST